MTIQEQQLRLWQQHLQGCNIGWDGAGSSDHENISLSTLISNNINDIYAVLFYHGDILLTEIKVGLHVHLQVKKFRQSDNNLMD